LEPTENVTAFNILTTVLAGAAIGAGFIFLLPQAQQTALFYGLLAGGGGVVGGLLGYFFYRKWAAALRRFIRRTKFESLAHALNQLGIDCQRATGIKFIGHLEVSLLEILVKELRKRDNLAVQIVNDSSDLYRGSNGDMPPIVAEFLKMDRERINVRHRFCYSRQLMSILELEVDGGFIVYSWRSKQPSPAFRFAPWTDSHLGDFEWEEIHPVSLDHHANRLHHNRKLLDDIFKPHQLGWSDPMFPPTGNQTIKEIWQGEILRWWANTGSELLTKCGIKNVHITWALTEHSLADAENVKEWLDRLTRTDGPAVVRYVYVDCQKYPDNAAYKKVVDDIIAKYLAPAVSNRGGQYQIYYLNFAEVPDYLREDFALMEGDAAFVQESDRKAIQGLLRVTISADHRSVTEARDRFASFAVLNKVARVDQLCHS